MPWLRLILLLAGLAFLGCLVWWERRRPRQAQDASLTRGERTEPSFTEPSLDQSSFAPAEAGAERARELRRLPPVIEWDDAVPAVGATVSSAPSERPAKPAAAPAMGGVDLPLPELPPLLVEWPAEQDRRIVTLRILSLRQDRLAGRSLRQGLTGCGFRHGQYGIFHLPEEDGRVVLSAASLVRPGMLDPVTMDFQRFAGINLFAVLPGPLSTELALERLGQVAVELAARVEGKVQDENGAPFVAADASQWRRRCLRAIDGTASGQSG